ncbi:MAG: SUMF1/EgtB/PvdO family nonheme iron enzyme, partial [Chloroflexota bacterium]
MPEPRISRFAARGPAVLCLTGLLLAGCMDGRIPQSVEPTSAASITSSAAPSVDRSATATAVPSVASTPVPSDGSAPGEERVDPSGVAQVWVPAGTFTMGTDAKAIAALEKQSPPAWVASEFPSEVPAHEVTVSKGYWIDKTEVSNADFAAFVDAGGYANQALWSEAGWAWLATKKAARLPLHC